MSPFSLSKGRGVGVKAARKATVRETKNGQENEISKGRPYNCEMQSQAMTPLFPFVLDGFLKGSVQADCARGLTWRISSAVSSFMKDSGTMVTAIVSPNALKISIE